MSTWQQSDDITKLLTALACAQSEFEAVEKGANNPFFKSKYADLPAVVKAASPILGKHGLCVSQLPDFDGEHDLLTTMIGHISGQWLRCSARLHLPKDDPQGQGSATTYMRRYAYSGGLSIVTEVDDDGNAASRNGAKKQQGSVRSAPSVDRETGEIAGEPESSGREQASRGEQAAASPASIASMKPRELNAALETAGLPTGGSVAQMRERLAAHLSGTTTTYDPGEEPF